MSREQEDWLNKRCAWLEEFGMDDADVLRDEYGEYILVLNDFSPEQVDEKKHYLPQELQS